MGRNSWTLMHRFDLCYDLLDKVKGNNLDGMALIFVWLRYSFMRQLDWQRNYNTKPRELGHAMDRLTLKLADRYGKEQGEHEIIRLIMSTLGRGSNAQRVRDEVLNIMHRHNIKEVSGRFMEEWHQKLHNNTTPDDIVICEAYIEFLRSNGNLHLFYQKLKEGGVTKERIESYERPIKSDPDFIPHLKDALIRDFEHFLGILKEVHTGTDLGVAIQTAGYLFDVEMHGLMDFIWTHRNDPDMSLLVKKITEARRRLAAKLTGPSYQVRDLLFLDISLEDFLRVAVERNLGTQLSEDQLVELLEPLLETLCLSDRDAELQHCLDHWKRLEGLSRSGKDWALHAEAVVDRVRRAIDSFIDSYHKLLQPKAEFLGEAFHADSWAISLFSEEVLRGRPAFVLAMILRYLDPVLRKHADLGNWQVISRGHGTGEVKVIETLKSVQGRSFERPMVLIAERITGDEEIPQGVAAIVTPTVIDGLSHLAIRARNDGILFAVCYDPETVEQLKVLEGCQIRLNVRNTNDIGFEESREEIGIVKPRTVKISTPAYQVAFTAYAVAMSDFNEHNVGYKSSKLRNIQGKLPDWIDLPPSAALPFGVFEKVLNESNSKEILRRYEELKDRIETGKDEEREGVLAELRKIILSLEAPEELVTSLRNVMEGAGLAWPSDWKETWMCIKLVWSSKWNERAYLSRRANSIPHEALLMSVLIQKVVESDYSFVIHTVNPLTGAKDEVYAEVVPGLGETLAANYPGRGLSFTCRKREKSLRFLSMPSKSIGLYGNGLIFRSDSNGEDLAGYAGAGLYDSFMLPSPRRASLDYTADALIWDEGFRKNLLIAIADIGMSVEEVMKSPQDIEGAYSKGKYFVVQTRPQVGIDNG
jgi:alpha-glucan,water dikinase